MFKQHFKVQKLKAIVGILTHVKQRPGTVCKICAGQQKDDKN